MPAGIDFGNQNCVIAVATPNGVEIVLNESSNRSTPTMVTFTGDRRYAGELANQNQMQFCQGTITDLKRLIMLPFDSEERAVIQKRVSGLVPLPDGMTGVEVEMKGEKGVLRPEQLVAYLLKGLVKIAKMKDPSIEKFVIAVSPWWTDKHRRAMLNACKIAGVDCISLVNSTTAAAIAYAMIHRTRLPPTEETPVPVAFVDFGNSSLNVAIALVKQGSVAIKSFADDNRLGGADFTEALADYLIEKVKTQCHVDPAVNARTMMRFRQAVEKAKKTLSANPVVQFEVQSVMGVDIAFPVKRDEFNEQIAKLVERIAAPIERALEYAGIKKEDLFEVQVLGGGSRVPAVYQRIGEVFGRQPQKSLDLDECFAFGSGYVGALLCPRMRVNLVVGEVTSHSLKACWEQGEQEIFKQFDFIPMVKRVKIPVEREVVLTLQSETEEIGKVRITTNVEESVEVNIGIGLTQSGTVEVTDALFDHDQKTHSAVVETLFNGDLSPEEIEKFQHVEAEFDAIDEMESQCEEARNELESLMFKTEGDVQRTLSEYLTPDESAELDDFLKQLHMWMDETGFEQVPLQEYVGRIEHLQGMISPIFRRKADYETLESKLTPLVAQAEKDRDALEADIPHTKLPEFQELLAEMDKFLEEAKHFKERPKYDPPSVDVEAVAQQVSTFRPRVEAIRKIPLAERRNQASFERVFETDEDMPEERVKYSKHSRPWRKVRRSTPFGGFGPLWFRE